MHFSNYQAGTADTAIYPDQQNLGGLIYATLGLSSEAGEVGGKVKKILRDRMSDITTRYDEDLDKIVTVYPIDVINDITGELGDVLWYLARVAEEIGVTLDNVARDNVIKLRSRKERGVIGGSGDKR